MNDSKIYTFLESLSQKELRKFRKFLESPYFNTNATLIALYDQMEAHIVSEDKRDLLKEIVWEALFPHESFDYDRLRKYMHKLMELAYDFLAQEIYQESEAHKAHYLLEMLIRKQMDEYLPNAIQSGITLMNKIQNRHGLYYYDLYAIEKYKYILANVESKRVKKSNIQNLNLSEVDENLNIFYISEKLRNYCLVLSWSKMIEIETNVPLIKEIIALVDPKYINIPSIAIYYQIFLTFIEPDTHVHFYNLKELIKSYIHLFPENEARDIVNAAINYTIQQQNKGNLSFAQDNFELWNHGLQTRIILVNDEISPWSFKNIITLALRLNQFKWVEDFIIEYGPKINASYRENAIYYNKASLYFYKKEYDKAIPLLQKVQFDEINYGLGAKSILLACYYELDEFDALYSHIDSFKVFIKRHKSITEDIKKSYIQLANYTKKLLETGSEKSKLKSLREEIVASQTSSKKWLLEKLDELAK